MARLLDLTRSLRRVGRMSTGVDRVERAYLRRFLTDELPCFGLIRSPLGYLLLDRAGMQRFADGLEGRTEWGAADRLSRVVRGREEALTQAEATLRQVALARCLPLRLQRMLSRHLPGDLDYFNVGHSNLTERVLRTVGDAGGCINVLIHDVIPLEFPELQRPGTVRPFQEKLWRVGRMADRVICPTMDTRDRVERLLSGRGRCPPLMVAPPGVDVATPDAAVLPEGLPPQRPYFVTVGTIEPRKNHGFLLDLWAGMGPDAPPLLICGSRGWLNEDVFARLDALSADGAVREVEGLDDAGLAALVQGAAALLAPSVSEGYGLPPVEALALGTRVLANDIPVFREVLGASAALFPVSERQNWVTKLRNWGQEPPPKTDISSFSRPTWEEHFKVALRLS